MKQRAGYTHLCGGTYIQRSYRGERHSIDTIDFLVDGTEVRSMYHSYKNKEMRERAWKDLIQAWTVKEK